MYSYYFFVVVITVVILSIKISRGRAVLPERQKKHIHSFSFFNICLQQIIYVSFVRRMRVDLIILKEKSLWLSN